MNLTEGKMLHHTQSFVAQLALDATARRVYEQFASTISTSMHDKLV